MIKILRKAMRNPEFDKPGFAGMKIVCYMPFYIYIYT